jgi:hypothetical protein
LRAHPNQYFARHQGLEITFPNKIHPHYYAKSQKMQPLRREAAHGQWIFAWRPEAKLEYQNVVIVDWGSLTGQSVMQMVRLAAESGAASILVCIFLSQLAYPEEAFLSSLRTLATHGSKAGSVAVRVTFLGRWSTAAFLPAECPICRQLAGLSNIDNHPVPLLAEFAKAQKHERLRLRTREEVVDASPHDFHRRPIEGASAIAMARFRERLTEALGRTKIRQELRQSIGRWRAALSADQQAATREILPALHFLSVEPEWLEKPPLCFEGIRGDLAEIAFGVAMNRAADAPDRINAALVLSKASPTVFAQRLAQVFSAALPDDEFCASLLYHSSGYLSMGLRNLHALQKDLQESLHSIQMAIAAEDISVSPKVAEALTILQVRTSIQASSSNILRISQPEAWWRLQQEFGYASHDPVPSRIWLMHPTERYAAPIKALLMDSDPHQAPQVRLDEDVLDWIRRLDEKWTVCCTFLDYTAFPLLYRIKKALMSTDCARELGIDTLEPLIDLVDNSVKLVESLFESKFSRLIRRVSEAPRELLRRQNWDDFSRQTRWFRERLLAWISTEKN